MEVHLAIVIDELGQIREDLFVANSLHEFDNYTREFVDSLAIRLKYQDVIQDFLLDNRHEIIKRETKYHKQRGKICAYYVQNNRLYFIKVAYKNKPVIRSYHELEELDEQKLFIRKLYEKVMIVIDKSNIMVSSKIRLLVHYLAQFGYLVNDVEITFLKRYYESNDESYLNCFFEQVYKRLENEWFFKDKGQDSLTRNDLVDITQGICLVKKKEGKKEI